MRNMALSLELAPVYIQKQHSGHSFLYERQGPSCVSAREELYFGETSSFWPRASDRRGPLFVQSRDLPAPVEPTREQTANNATRNFDAE